MTQKQHEGQRRAPQSDDLAFKVCQPEAQVFQGAGAPNSHEVPVIGAGLHGAPAALQRYVGQDVVPQIAQHAAGVGQLCVPSSSRIRRSAARQRAWAEHVVDAEGLGWRGGRRGGVVHSGWELLLQLQIVQNEPVAVVGYAQAVRGLAIRGSGEVGADPVCAPSGRSAQFSVPSAASTQYK